MTSVRIGTRGSALALAQARLVADALAEHGVRHQLVIVETAGDRRAPDTAWGEGAFVSAIEQALLSRRADVAVHSAKDLPTDEDPRLTIAAYLRREDARDALVVAGGIPSRTLATLPEGSVVGTDSPRRSGFLRWHRPDLRVRPIHGNVDTRLRRLDEGEVDALVLAVAGLVRLGRGDRIDELLPSGTLPPAPGQGAIAVQVRRDDRALVDACGQIDDRPTRLAVEAERAFLRAAGGGCRAPIGAMAEVAAGRLRLMGGFATVDGRAAVVEVAEGPLAGAESLAVQLAARLGSRQPAAAARWRVMVTRPTAGSAALAARLAEQGIEALPVPAIEIELGAAGGPLDEALRRAGDYDWIVVTSPNGARSVGRAASRLGVDPSVGRWAAVGDATVRALRAVGVTECWQPATASGDAVGQELPVAEGSRLLLVRGSLADGTLPETLRQRGALVDAVTAYETREAPAGSRRLLTAALAGGMPDAVLFASPSAVRGLLTLADDGHTAEVLAIPAVAIGAITAAEVRRAGFRLLGEAATQDARALAELSAQLLRRRTVRAPA